jgi:hypothetical protein
VRTALASGYPLHHALPLVARGSATIPLAKKRDTSIEVSRFFLDVFHAETFFITVFLLRLCSKFRILTLGTLSPSGAKYL